MHEAEKVAESLNLTLIDMRFVKPLDEDILKNHLKQADLVVTLEDGCIAGGAGLLLCKSFAANKVLIQGS